MSGETVLSWIFLAVSALAFGVQLVGLDRALTDPRPGLTRTVACRVAAAGTYVLLGVATIASRDNFPVFGLVIFSATQAMWLANTIADVRTRPQKEVDHGQV